MADKENSVRFTRAAKKRAGAVAGASSSAAPALAENQPAAKRKRVPLQELSSIANAGRRRPKPNAGAKEKKSRKKPAISGTRLFDPSFCQDDAADIDAFLRSLEMEKKRRPLEDYIEVVQKDITPHMRGILVDWLVEVAEEYKLVPETLYLTVAYIDRFLSRTALSRQKLQLLGVACMLVASKYEEISPPRVDDFCYITDNTYSKQELVKMEADVLKFLKFEMGNPTINFFLRSFTIAEMKGSISSNLKVKFLCNYLAELSLVEYSCVRFLPSVVAASTLFVARLTVYPDTHPWNPELKLRTGYQPSQLKECIEAISGLQSNKKESSLSAVRDKYKHHGFKCVSLMNAPPEIPQSYLEDC